jgi:tetratricopeptide (TPR) repeat protein
MRRLTSLLTALLFPVAQPLILGTAVTSGALLFYLEPAQAQSAEAVAKVAQAITVRIEGATQGSGVLVKRDGNRYTVLTAWHVVSGQRPREELDIYTPDGQRHKVEEGSIKHLGEVDMAMLSFLSSNSYEVAQVGDVKSVSSGSGIYVAGFPLPTSAVPTRLWRFLDGKVIANATVTIPNGYQLLYSNPTLPGMSGGAVMNAQGQLVGIHASAERADQISESSGKAVATGTNQAVPIAYYSQYSTSAAVVASSTQASTADDYLVQAQALLGKKGREQEVIRLASQVLATKQTADAYYYRASAKSDLGDQQGAIADYKQVIAINPQYIQAYVNRGRIKDALGDKQGSSADYSQAIAGYSQAIDINPLDTKAYARRGSVKSELGDMQGAIADYSQAIATNTEFAPAYGLRGEAKHILGDYQGAIADYSQVISINPKISRAYYLRGNAKYALGDQPGAITDYSQAIAINPSSADSYTSRARILFKTGEIDGAISDIRSALRINPDDGLALFDLAWIWKTLGDSTRMCEALTAASGLGVDRAKAQYQKYCDFSSGK